MYASMLYVVFRVALSHRLSSMKDADFLSIDFRWPAA